MKEEEKEGEREKEQVKKEKGKRKKRQEKEKRVLKSSFFGRKQKNILHHRKTFIIQSIQKSIQISK